MKKYLFLIITLFSLVASAQLLEGKTKLLKADNSDAEALFELNADTRIYTYQPEYGWYKMRVEAYVAQVSVSDKEIAAGTELQNKDGDIIGKTLTDFRVKESRLEDKYRGEKRMIVILEGYVFKTKIKEETMPEDVITKALATKNRTEQNAMLEDLYDLYDFEKREFEDFEVHVLREDGKTLNEEKDFRIIVINRGYGVFGIVTNAQDITLPKVKEVYEDGKFKSQFLYKPSAAQKTLMEDILYTYLAL